MKKVTPELIQMPLADDIVLIGTNESGIHGGGIARIAYDKWGARLRQGFGMMSPNTFGLPTKDWTLKTLPLNIINFYVERYIAFIRESDVKINHLITKVGCGLAGYSVPDIAPMFKPLLGLVNVSFPQDFYDFYDGTYKPSSDEQIEFRGLFSQAGELGQEDETFHS